MSRALFKFKLQAVDASSFAAFRLHLKEIKLPHLPRPGDFIKEQENGYAEIIRVVFDVNGETTLVIK